MPCLIAAGFFVSLSLLPNLNGQSPRYQSSLRSRAAAARRSQFERCIPTSIWGMEAILPVARQVLRRNTALQARTGRLLNDRFRAANDGKPLLYRAIVIGTYDQNPVVHGRHTKRLGPPQAAILLSALRT